MRFIFNKCYTKAALLPALMIVLAACGGADDLDKELERTSNFTVVNALNYSADFYLQRRNISTDFNGLFDSRNRVFLDIQKNSSGGSYTYRYNSINPMLNIGVRQSMNSSDEEKLYKSLGGNENFWLIAWDSAGDNTLTLVDKSKNDQSAKINVRIFADSNYSISVNGAAVGRTKQGEITTFYSLDNCNNSLKVNDKAIDLCSGDYGASYLLVVDKNGKRLISKE